MIKASNLSHKYKNDIALKDINIEIKPAQFVALIGESGSGKSTLLSILSTLLKPTKGELFFNGTNYKQIKDIDEFRQSNVGFIFQFHFLINYLTIKDNIKLAQKNPSEKEVFELLKLLKIEELANKYPNEISGGQRQRASIARALINKPQVVFADEPTGNLDSKNSENIFNIFKKLCNEGTTIIVATHNLKLSQLCDITYEVKDGQI